MNRLENREIKILKILSEAKDYLPVHNIAETLGISTKTAYRDIEKIINKRDDVRLLKKQGKGIKIEFLDVPLEEMSSKKLSKYSVEERRIKILYYLLKNTNNYTSIEELSEIYYVGKSSIVNDLNYIEADLLADNLILKKDRNGTKIVGDEKNIRKKIMHLIRDYSFVSDNPTEEYFSDRIPRETIRELATKFDVSKIAIIEKVIAKHENKLPYTIGDLYYTNLVVHILIAIERIKKDNYIEEETLPKISDKRFYNEAEGIALELEREFNVTLPASEIYYIYQYLVSTGVGSLNNNIVIDVDEEISSISSKFLTGISKEINFDVINNESIYYLFKLHIRALLRRLKYGISVKNPLLEKIREEYSKEFTTIKEISKSILRKEISDDEIAYLTIYIESILNLSDKKINVILVCNSGFGTSLFLKKRIEDKLSNIEVVDVVPAKDLKKQRLEKIDFIISTVKLDEDMENIIYVNVMLREEDILTINRRVYGEINEI